ncbi:MAG: hypothetical protein WCH83_16940 [Alphaproteobacteria bacterium]|jgi:hypothetical protein
MTIGQTISNVIRGNRAGASDQAKAAASVPTRTYPTRPGTTGVNVTLSPEAREHITRLEAFTATIGTSRQPKTMGKPGLRLDVTA